MYTFHLREGVKFQPPVDREVTAADFKYSFERMMSEPRAPATSFYMGVVGADEFMAGKADEITGFKAVDDSTVEITLEVARPLLPQRAHDGVLRRRAAGVGRAVGQGDQPSPARHGRFMFESWTPGQEIVLKKNPNYWEEGKPYLDEIRYALSFTPSTALLKLQQGEIDALGDGVPPSDIARLQQDPEWMDYVFTQPLIAIMLSVPQRRYASRSTTRRSARRSRWAVDRDKLVKLQAGQAPALYQFYPPGMPGHVEGKEYYGYDPEKAKQLLAEAGFPDGFETMLYTDNVDPNPKLMQSVQADLKAIGIKADLKTMSNNTYYNQQCTPKTLTHGQFRLVDGLPRPERLDRPAVQQGERRARRHELELLVEPGARGRLRRGAGDDRPEGAHRRVLGDAGHHRRRHRLRAAATRPSRRRCARRTWAGSTCTRCTRSTRGATGGSRDRTRPAALGAAGRAGQGGARSAGA